MGDALLKFQNFKSLFGIITRLFVVFAIAYFGYCVYQQLEHFQWQPDYTIPLLITSLTFVLTNTVGAYIWYLLLQGIGEKQYFATTTRIFFISQIAKYIPGNIAHLLGRVVMAKSAGLAATNVSYTLVFELVLLVFSSILFATATIAYVDIDTIAGPIPTLTELLYIGVVCLATIVLIIYLSPKLSARIRQQNILQIPTMPRARVLLNCILLYLFAYFLLGLSTNFLAHAIFDIDIEGNFLFICGIFTIAFVGGFLAPGSPAGIGVREIIFVLLLTPIYGELAAVGIAAFTRIAQMLGDCITLFIGSCLPKVTMLTGSSSLTDSSSAAIKRQTKDAPAKQQHPSAIYWGTYDLSKPRNPILLNSLAQAGCKIVTCHENIWAKDNDKSQIRGIGSWFALALRYLLAYPALIMRFMRLQKPDFIMIGYLGHLDVFMLWPFAKLRGIPIVWDAFISLYNTVVEDRKLFGKHHPLSIAIYCWEWLACRLATTVLLDTNAHADYFRQKYALGPNKVIHAFVGAEEYFFQQQLVTDHSSIKSGPINILFYGTFIPLHGISTIIKASRLVPSDIANWTIIGKGQESNKIQAELDSAKVSNLTWITWVPYEQLVDQIHAADICLGIFGNTQKSAMVIPNKVFQIIAAGKPIVTRDSPAIAELLGNDDPGIWLIPAENEEALAQAILEFYQHRHALDKIDPHASLKEKILPKTIGSKLVSTLNQVGIFN